MEQFSIEWIDSGREPQCRSNPNYPTGMDVDVASGAADACKVNVPYPAKRCGMYVVQCRLCGYSVAVTTAGRKDDPRSVRFPCLKMAVA